MSIVTSKTITFFMVLTLLHYCFCKKRSTILLLKKFLFSRICFWGNWTKI